MASQLSIHVRGPFNLKEVAVYNLAADKTKRDGAPSSHVHARRHGHHHHLHKEKNKKRGEWITATIDGQVVSWVNNWFGGAPATEAAVAAPTENAAAAIVPAPEPTTEVAAAVPKSSSSVKQVKAKTTTSQAQPSDSSSSGSAAGGDWERVAYYNAEQQVADNIVFLGNYGGGGSGVFDK